MLLPASSQGPECKTGVHPSVLAVAQSCIKGQILCTDVQVDVVEFDLDNPSSSMRVVHPAVVPNYPHKEALQNNVLSASDTSSAYFLFTAPSPVLLTVPLSGDAPRFPLVRVVYSVQAPLRPPLLPSPSATLPHFSTYHSTTSSSLSPKYPPILYNAAAAHSLASKTLSLHNSHSTSLLNRATCSLSMHRPVLCRHSTCRSPPTVPSTGCNLCRLILSHF
jgi:hypothetical protein